MSIEGIPAVYFNSLFGKSNDEAKYIITGNKRDVNRYKWNYKNILKKLLNIFLLSIPSVGLTPIPS